MITRIFVAIAALALALAACHRGMPQGETPAVLMPGKYRAVLELPPGELPFGLDIESEGATTVGYLIRLPGYENRLIADATDGRLLGEVVLSKAGGQQQHIRFRAQLGQTYRFFEKDAGDPKDVSGRWAVTFTGADGSPEAAVGEFSQSGDIVTGTFLTQTGDHRFLAGQVRDDELHLSTFDGAHAFLYRAKPKSDGALAGQPVTSNDPIFRGKGVEIVSLMFEHFGDFPRAAAATQRFRQHYGVEYATLIAGVSDKDEAAKKLPMLERVYAFPTTIFIDRRGFVREVKATLDQLLAES